MAKKKRNLKIVPTTFNDFSIFENIVDVDKGVSAKCSTSGLKAKIHQKSKKRKIVQ